LGASNPTAIPLTPFERQFPEFGEARSTGSAPACSGIDGFSTLQLVHGIYKSYAGGRRAQIRPESFAPGK
jgi:predicted dehydrogenase